MFKIYDGRDKFFQWDLDRKLIVEDRSIAAAHFCNRTGTSSLSCDCYEEDGKWIVDVPNVCLQESYRLKVYGFCENKYTMEVALFDVEARTKPEEYAYTEEEINCWQELDERIQALEGQVSEEAMAAAIEAYFAANPIEKGAIEIVNASGDEIIELDKTYDEIMEMIEAGKVVVINYDGNLYHQFGDRPIFRYVGSAETRQISFNPRDYSVRYSEDILPTYEDVGTIVEEYLEGYAKTTDIPDVSGYQTAEQVQTAIENYVGVIENGSY